MSRIGLGLAALAASGAALILLPAPSWVLWLAHLVALETSLTLPLVALLALVLARGGLRGRVRAARWTAGLAVPAAAVGLMPFAAAAPLYLDAGRRFSLGEYAFGTNGPSVREQRDVVLDPAVPALRADLYHGAGAAPRPLVVVVHGGSWQSGDKGEAAHLSRLLAAAGRSVADVRYRLAPEHRFPSAAADVKCLLGRLRERAAELGLDPRRVALLGRSAGGQIALVAAYSAGDPRLPPSCDVADEPVQAVVSAYAPTDLAWGHANPARPDVVRGPASLEAYLGGTPAERPDAYRLGSPQSWLSRPLPPTLLVHGTWDRLVRFEHARRLHAALRASGHPVRLLEVPLADHGFDRRAGGIGEQLARAEILEFLGGL